MTLHATSRKWCATGEQSESLVVKRLHVPNCASRSGFGTSRPSAPSFAAISKSAAWCASKTVLDAENLRSPVRMSKTGRRTGGGLMSRGHACYAIAGATAGLARRRQGSAGGLVKSQLVGWSENPKAVEGFIEPELELLEGDPETAKVAVARTRRWRRAAVTGSRRGVRQCGKARRLGHAWRTRSRLLGQNHCGRFWWYGSP